MAERFDNSPLSFVDREFAEGYLDGRDLETLRPGRNRSPAYRHSWMVGRRERRGKNWPYAVAMRRAEIAEAKMRAHEGVGG